MNAIADDELLREPLGIVGHASVVLDQELDVLAGDRCSSLLQEHSDRGIGLPSGRLERTGHRQDCPDPYAVLGKRRRAAACERQGHKRNENIPTSEAAAVHRSPP